MNKKKDKLLILISSHNFFRNYLLTDALSKIKEKYDCHFIFQAELKDVIGRENRTKYFFYKYKKEQYVIVHKIFNILMRRYKNKSTSFKFRISRIDNIDIDSNTPPILIPLKFTSKIIFFLFKKIKFTILTNKFVFNTYFDFLVKRVPINSGILSVVKKIDPSLIIFPCSAYDVESFDLVNIGKSRGISTLFLVDNWDNLSSKSLFWQRPSHVAVWGEQSLEHAKTIQGFSSDQVTCIGTPRFDHYFISRDLKLKNIFSFKYILFVGTVLKFEEADALKILNDVLDKNESYFKGVKIVYRPHPWRQGRDSILGMNLKHVVIDPQLADIYSKKLYSQKCQLDLNYYSSLIKNSELVIGGLTSMIIESLIFRKCFLALIYNDKKNTTSQDKVFRAYEHFKGLKKIKAINFCKNISHMEKDLKLLWRDRYSIDFNLVDEQRRFFCYDDSKRYSERLNDLCQKLLIKSN